MTKFCVEAGSMHTGELQSDGSIKWTRVEGVSLAFALESPPEVTADIDAKRILNGSPIPENDVLMTHVRQRLSAYMHSHNQILEYLHPSGPHQVNHKPTDFGVRWASYLMEGRMLVDKLGEAMAAWFPMNQKMKRGINADGFKKVRSIAVKEPDNDNARLLVALVDKFEQPITTFIALRDQEKISKNTLTTVPKVMPDGEVLDGTIRLASSGTEFQFIPYLTDSYYDVIEFAKAVCRAT